MSLNSFGDYLEKHICVYLFGGGNAWIIKFDNNFPSELKLEHANGNGYELVPVTATGRSW